MKWVGRLADWMLFHRILYCPVNIFGGYSSSLITAKPDVSSSTWFRNIFQWKQVPNKIHIHCTHHYHIIQDSFPYLASRHEYLNTADADVTWTFTSAQGVFVHIGFLPQYFYQTPFQSRGCKIQKFLIYIPKPCHTTNMSSTKVQE